MGNRWASSRCMTQLAHLGALAALQGALPLPVLHLPLFLTTCSPLALPCLLLPLQVTALQLVRQLCRGRAHLSTLRPPHCQPRFGLR